MSQLELIDKAPVTGSKPGEVKVLVLGMSRTGRRPQFLRMINTLAEGF